MTRIEIDAPAALAQRCKTGDLRVHDVAREVADRMAAGTRPEAWIHRATERELGERAAALDALDAAQRAALPLCGVPFAVKDNIDVAGVPTTAGCPAYAYVPENSAPVVQALLDAGALFAGKTHMDQFATGLVGTRSPYGPCRNAYSAEHIAGGSSSGSAVAVALRQVSLALGTDTAGSGRVPAALNGIIGLKPTRGLLSVDGVVPACRSLDCVSLFSAEPGGARLAFDVLRGAAHGPRTGGGATSPILGAPFRFGILAAHDLADLDGEDCALYARGVEFLVACGGAPLEIDYAPFLEAAALLYDGPWVAERHAAVGDFIDAHPECVDPAVAAIITGARRFTARQAFAGFEALERLRQRVAPLWQQVSVLAVPTVPRVLRIADVLADPIRTNSSLGRHNNFMNLLDLCGCVVPIGRRENGTPAGLTLCAPACADAGLLELAIRIDNRRGVFPPPSTAAERIAFVVAGAHLSGMPLNGDLVSAGGRLDAAARTSADYRLYALAGTVPPKPGLCRTTTGGVPIDVEVWSLQAQAFGAFVAAIPRPLAMGKVTLDDGRELPGFTCTPEALAGATDISEYGGWRHYVTQRRT